MRFGRKNRQPEFNDPITQDQLGVLNDRLAEIDNEIAERRQKASDSFDAKVRGEKQDLQHNIDSDVYYQAIESRQEEKAEIVARIERISSGLASIALDN